VYSLHIPCKKQGPLRFARCLPQFEAVVLISRREGKERRKKEGRKEGRKEEGREEFKLAKNSRH
jgi:hypothetical protein